MATPHPPSQDLTRLIGQAEDESRDKVQAARQQAPRPDDGRPNRWAGAVAAAAVVVALAVWAQALGGHGLTRDLIAQDLQQLVGQAQQQVEQYQQRHGVLPAALPDVTLSTVVTYRVEDAAATPPTYSLVARMRDVEARGPVAPAGAKP